MQNQIKNLKISKIMLDLSKSNKIMQIRDFILILWVLMEYKYYLN